MLPSDLPKELCEALDAIVLAALSNNPLPEGDYGTAPYDIWLRISTSRRYAATLEELNKALRRHAKGTTQFVLSHERYFTTRPAHGLLVALVPKDHDHDHVKARHFCIGAANINGVFEVTADDYTDIRL